MRKVARIWRDQPVFQRRNFFLGRSIRENVKDISWLDVSGEEMTDEAWQLGYARCVGVRLAGDIIGDVDERGEPIVGDTLLLLLNAHHDQIRFTLPATHGETEWECVFDTAKACVPEEPLAPHSSYDLEGRSMAVLLTRVSADRLEETSSSDTTRAKLTEAVAEPQPIEKFRPPTSPLTKPVEETTAASAAKPSPAPASPTSPAPAPTAAKPTATAPSTPAAKSKSTSKNKKPADDKAVGDVLIEGG